MIITRLEITAFGKLKSFTLELERGLNTFTKANEWGKSTLTDFIVFMLYGFKKTAKKTLGIEDNLLKKYLPWSGEGYIAGAITLEGDGKTVRIERRTLESGRTRLTVLDAGGNELSVTEPGEEFFGVDRDTFLRSFLVRQTDIYFDGTDGIETALKNLVTTGDEDTSFDAAMKIITDKKNAFQHGDRRSGRIFDIPKLITSKKLELSELEQKYDTYRETLLKSRDIDENIKNCRAYQSELEKKMPAARGNDAKKLLSQTDKLDGDIAALNEKLKGADSPLADIIADFIRDTFRRAAANKQTADENTQKIVAVQGDIDAVYSGFPDYALFDKNREELEDIISKKPSPNVWVAVAGFALALACGIAGAALSNMLVLGIGAAVGLLLAVLGLAVLKIPVRVPEKYRRTLSELRQDFEKYQTAKDSALRLETTLSVYRAAADDAGSKQSEINSALQKIKDEYGIESESALDMRIASAQNTDMISQQLERLVSQRDALLDGADIEKLKDEARFCDGSDLTTSRLSAMIAETSQKLSALLSENSALEGVKIEAAGLSQKIFNLNSEIELLEKELSEKLYKNSVLELAKTALNEAHDKINNTYSPILAKRVCPYLSKLTDGKYSEITVDKDFNIRVKADGQYRELGYFSRGTADAVYFAVRIVMTEILSQKSVPLVFDDPFWSLDEKRLESAAALVDTISKDRQVILFGAR